MSTDIRGEWPEHASNVLVLAPLTPAGNRACLELLTATAPPDEINVISVTYTQPPHTWLSDWRANVGELPTEMAFIHANDAESTGENVDETPANIDISKVAPSQPMDIISPLSEHLTRWEANGNRTVVSVQTLTVLLEYVDFDTAFRYLHILTHRIRAANAMGFYQMDPEIHDEETISTLEPLFDAVVKIDPEGSGWTVTETFSHDQRAGVAEDHVQSHHVDHEDDAEGGPFASVRTWLSRLLTPPDQRPPSPTTGPSSDETDGTPDADSPVPFSGTVGPESENAADDADERVPDERADEDRPDPEDEFDDFPEDVMMSDEDRIRQLLTEYGGRMKQADVTAETDWSKSTVSRKLSAMEEDGLITRVQVGRGNLVFLSGYEPESAQPPFEPESRK